MEKSSVPNLDNLSVQEISEWLFKLAEPNLTLHDINISNKTFYDWRKQKIVSPVQEKSSKEVYKELSFSFYECVWFMLVKDLRKMGLTYNSIRALRNNLWEQLPEDLYLEFLKDENIETMNQIHPKGTNTMKRMTDFLKDKNIEIPKGRIKFHWFELMVNGCLISNNDAKILFRYDGMISFLNNVLPVKLPGTNELFSVSEEYDRDFKEMPHCIIPIEKYIKEFFVREENIVHLVKYGFINEQEAEILETIRAGNLKELRVKMNQDTSIIQGYDVVRDGDISREEIFHLTRTFFLKAYENVTFKWKNNKTVYFERITKKRFI